MFRPLLTSLFICNALVAFGQDTSAEGRKLMEAVASKSKTVSYVGIRKVKMRMAEGKRTEFKEYVMRWKGKTRIEYPSDSPYAGLKIWEENGVRKTLTLATNEIRESRVRGMDFSFLNLRGGRNRGARAYKLTVKDGGKIAGQSTKVVHISVGDSLRQSVWVDTKKSVILRRSFLDSRGSEFAGFRFERIKYDAKIDPKKFELPKGAKVVEPRAELLRSAAAMKVKAYTLSRRSGYKLMSVRKDKLGDRETLRQFFESGSEKVSLMILKGDRTKVIRSGKRGRTQVYSWLKGDVTLVLVGEMDEAKLRRLAGSVIVEQR